MRIHGTVMDAAKERPLAKAKVVLYVGETELVTFYSDKEGKFEVEQELDQHIGESLVCRVEKAAFKPREASHRIGHEDIRLDIELVPEKREEEIELKISVRNDKKSPLERVKISLEIDGKEVGVGFSDKNGLVKFKLSPDLEEKSVKFKAELGGYDLAAEEIHLKRETTQEITMTKAPRPPNGLKWKKVAVAVGILIAICIAGYLLFARRDEPKPPKPRPGIHVVPPRRAERVRPRRVEPVQPRPVEPIRPRREMHERRTGRDR